MGKDLLLQDIHFYMWAHGVKPTPFGVACGANWGLVKRLEEGSPATEETEDKCYAHMESNGWVTLRAAERRLKAAAVTFKKGQGADLESAALALQKRQQHYLTLQAEHGG